MLLLLHSLLWSWFLTSTWALNRFADDVLDTSPLCLKAKQFVAQNMTELDQDFASSSLFYTEPLIVCQNIEHVQRAAALIARSCHQESFEEASGADLEEKALKGVYKSWSHPAAAKAACYRIGRIGYCLQEVYANEDENVYSAKVICSKCQKDYWTSIDLCPAWAPMLHEYVFVQPYRYMERVRRICGSQFFEPGHIPSGTGWSS